MTTNSEEEIEITNVVLTQLMKMNAVITGIVFGLLLGLGIFLATIFLVIKGGPVVGPHLELLNQYFIGYHVTFVGSLIGLAYGFVLGFVIGFGFALIYNWIAGLREARNKAKI